MAALALASAVAPPAGAQTLTANPRAFRAYLRREISKDLAELHKAANALLAMLDAEASLDRRKADDLAEKIVDRAHDVWRDVQMQRPTRKRPKPDPNLAPRPLDAARADVVEARGLVREVARDVSAEWRGGAIDVRRRVSMLEKLERIELIGHQLRADLRPLAR